MSAQSRPAGCGWHFSASPPRASPTATSPSAAGCRTASNCSGSPVRMTPGPANSTAGSPSWSAKASPDVPKPASSTASEWCATQPAPTTLPTLERPLKEATQKPITSHSEANHEPITNHNFPPKPAEMATQLWREITQKQKQESTSPTGKLILAYQTTLQKS